MVLAENVVVVPEGVVVTVTDTDTVRVQDVVANPQMYQLPIYQADSDSIEVPMEVSDHLGYKKRLA